METDHKLRKAFTFRLRKHVSHQDGSGTAAPSLVFADADFEAGDGRMCLHEDDKQANEPAIIYVRADAYMAALAQIDSLTKEQGK